MPLAEVLAMRFSVVETGVRDVVRRLVRIGAHPVWSCQGHPGRTQPDWLWYSGRKNLQSAEMYVRWDWPVVICAGGMHEMLRVYKDGIWQALLSAVVGCRKLYPCTAIPVHIRPGSSLRAMKHAAPRTRGWYLLAFAKPRRSS